MTRSALEQAQYHLDVLTAAHQKCLDSQAWLRARIRTLEEENRLLRAGHRAPRSMHQLEEARAEQEPGAMFEGVAG